MFAGEEEEEEEASRGMEGGRGELELFKDELSFRDLVFSQYSKRHSVVRGSLSSYQTPECVILEIVLPFQLS